MGDKILTFPDDFKWGAATAAYQIEGAFNKDGKGESIWDRFSHTEGEIQNNENGDKACDHYHRYHEDIERMKEIGLKAYRMSISWTRVIPEGKGKVNQSGIDFYKRLTDKLLENNITPFITLYHWCMPQALENAGGWANKDTSKYFGDYTETIVNALNDRIKNWLTINEAIYVILNGYENGSHAPGRREDQKTINQVRHNVLLAHGIASKIIKTIDSNLKVGIAHNPVIIIPENDKADNLDKLAEKFHQLNAPLFDPIFKGVYSEATMKEYGDNKPDYSEEELKIISTPNDYIGVNTYGGTFVKWDDSTQEYKDIPFSADFPITDFGWPVTTESLYWGMKLIKEIYGVKDYYITESGCYYDDVLEEDGRVHDKKRIDYVKGALSSVHRAIQDEINVKGFFHWSLMDNFEWAMGYKPRFGLIYIDYQNDLKRILKDSAHWYKSVIEKNSVII